MRHAPPSSATAQRSRSTLDLDEAVPHGYEPLITLATMRSLLADVERREIAHAPDEFREETRGA